MKNQTKIELCFLCLIVLGTTTLHAVDTDASVQTSSSTNSRVNVRDRNSNELTADQAKENPSDRLLMQKIRRSVVTDKGLSFDAHNIKIIAVRGQVTIKGPVDSEDEHRKVLAKATSVAGDGKVIDEVSVKENVRKQ